MANVKISQLPSLSTMTDIAQIPVVAGGTTYQITGANLSSYFGGDSYGNANVAANLAAFANNPILTTGNITSGNVNTGVITLTNGAVIKDNAGDSVAFGQSAGGTSQGVDAVAIGNSAGSLTQGNLAVAIGNGAGQTSQGAGGIAIGTRAAGNMQGTIGIAIGLDAGYDNQGDHSIAIGRNAGLNFQGDHSIALGYGAAGNAQGAQSIAIGQEAGTDNQGYQTVAIGFLAGRDYQGDYSIAIGSQAGTSPYPPSGHNIQANNSIILNATGTYLNTTTANTFTVAPVRNDVANTAQVMFYNATSKEVTYGNTISVAGNIGAGNVNVTTATGNLVFGRASATGSPGINSTSSVTVVSDRFGTPKEWVFGTDGSFAGLGNISGGNVNTGKVANTGNLTFTAGSSSWNLDTTGNLTVPGNINAVLASPAPSLNNFDSISAANLSASGNVISVRVSASGNITGGNVLTGGLISATGNITGGNATLGTLTLSGNTISSTDAIITIDPSAAGNTGAVIIQGNLSVTGNVTYIDSNTITTNDLVINMANNAATAAAANGGGIGVGPVTGAYATITYNSTANIWAISNGASVTGNVTGSNVNTGGLVSATGNVTGGNLVTAAAVSAGSVSASGNIISNANIIAMVGSVVTENIKNQGGTGIYLAPGPSGYINFFTTTGDRVSITDSGNMSAVGNVIGGNLNAAGLSMSGNVVSALNLSSSLTAATTISAVGNITGGNILGGANVNATTHTGTTVSVTGNITGGNINTGAQVVATGNITGGNLRSTSLSLSGNVISALNASSSIAAGTTISAAGNVTGGNVTTAGLTNTASLSITGNTATVTSANYSIGYLEIPQVTLSANTTAGLTDSGKHYYSTTAGNLELTIPDNSNVAFPVGTAISVVVQAGGNVLVVTQPSTTLYLGGNATSGNRVVGTYGMATIMKVATNTWFISGTGVS